MAAINCKALLFVYNWITRKKFGISYGDIPIDPLLSNFYETTGCKEVLPCEEEDPCVDEDFIMCNLSIEELEVTQMSLDGTVILNVVPKNGTSPYTAQWTIDSNHFIIEDGQGTTTLTIKKIDDVVVLTSVVSVALYDSVQCVARQNITLNMPTALVDCDSAIFDPNIVFEGINYDGSLEIFYTGGNGESFTGSVFHSEGVTGLTATIISGNLNTGAGVLHFVVHGTPASSGTAFFDLNIFGFHCTPQIGVGEMVCANPTLHTEIGDYDSIGDSYPVRLYWTNLGNALNYQIALTIDGVPQSPAFVTPPDDEYIFDVPSSASWSGTFITHCTVGLDSEIIEISGSVPAAGECTSPDVVDITYVIGLYNTTTGKWSVDISWPVIPNADTYQVINLVDSSTHVVSDPEITLEFPPGDTSIIIIKTDCGGGSQSLGVFKGIVTPDAPFPPPPPYPEVLRMTNVGAPDKHLDLWFKLDSSFVSAKIKQGDLFGSFVAETAEMTKGVSNGYTPLPVGFTTDDIYFNGDVLPDGYPIVGNDVTKVLVTLKTGSFAYDFNYIMNVPQAYTTRQDTLDYIPLYDSDVVTRPYLEIVGLAPGMVTVKFHYNTLNYDACSSYNIFAVSTLGIVTGSPTTYTADTYTFALPPGNYYIFFEMTYDACTISPAPIVTAVPIPVTIS